MWYAKWRIKLNPEKPARSYSPGPFSQKNRTKPETVWRDTKSLSSSEVSRNYFDLQLTFQKLFEDILHRCNIRYNRLKLLVNQKLGPSPSTIICPKLLHDSAGLPYVKDRLLSCATKSLDRIAQNPPVEESISSSKLNPASDRYPMALSVVHPVSL